MTHVRASQREPPGGDFQSFDGRKDGYGRGDDPIAIKKTGAENARQHQRGLKAGETVLSEPDKSPRRAKMPPPVVGTEDKVTY